MIVIVTVVCIIVFSSSATIPSDYKELRKNLRDAEFEVQSTTDGEEAIGYFSDLVSSLTYYEDEGLEDDIDKIFEDMSETADEAVLKDITKSADCAVMAVDEDEENFIIALYFDDSKYADEFLEIFNPVLKFIQENGSDSYIFDEIKREDFTFGKSGNIVYVGTKDALDACK